ncbi:MAG TPA: hypothetical protein PKA93_15025, partial [Arachnia sp.]|nr:hypothetical protein [Arachnia sp.]
APTLEPEAKKRRGPLIGALAGVAVVVVIAASIAGGLPRGGETPVVTTSPQPQDPVILRVPPVEALEGTVEGDKATFTWKNPDPKDGDSYMYEELSVADERPPGFVDEPVVVVDAQPGRTCVNVSLRRSDGRVSSPVRGCVES